MGRISISSYQLPSSYQNFLLTGNLNKFRSKKMNKKILTTILTTILLTTASANAATKVFACEPEWASLAKEIGGDKIEAFSATTAQEDPHHVRAKPSLIAAMRKSDLVICSGASLEVGWLPILLQSAGNVKVQPGSAAFLEAAKIVPVLEKPTSVDRAQGDVHPEGNPHVQLNPHNIAIVAKELAARLGQIDAPNAAYYQAQYAAFDSKWQQAIKRWEADAAALKGTAVIAHHSSFTYLENWLGLVQVGTLEPKPGVPPTTGHLEELLKDAANHPAKAIIHTAYEPDDASKWLSEKTGTPAITLPYTIGGNADSKDLFGLFDSTVALLKGAVK
jgi:zinc/manganese transport system substrate-binding protein